MGQQLARFSVPNYHTSVPKYHTLSDQVLEKTGELSVPKYHTLKGLTNRVFHDRDFREFATLNWPTLML
jgi:hypothetical protein